MKVTRATSTSVSLSLLSTTPSPFQHTKVCLSSNTRFRVANRGRNTSGKFMMGRSTGGAGAGAGAGATSKRSVAIQAQVEEVEMVEVEQEEGTDENSRLWSNLNEETLKHEPGSLMGSIALVAGTTVGAGILALPAVTKDAGYVPSSAVIVACWLYSCVTGLLIAETNIRLMCELGRGGVSVLSMAKNTYGKTGGVLAGSTYMFLHYALLVAYLARGGELLTEIIDTSPTAASLAFAMLLGTTTYVSEPKVLDSINTSLVVAIVFSFTAILAMALSNFDASGLQLSDPSKAIFCVPVVALAFVFHNIIPVVASNLEGDRKKIRNVILAGTSIPLVMFLLWNMAILGFHVDSDSGELDPLKLLQSDDKVGPYITVFSLLAVATSFIGFVLGLVDFIGDGLKLPINTKNVLPFALTLFPPTVFAILKPDIFMSALEYAGTYGVLGLFGVLPAGMAWRARKRDDLKHIPSMVPGGAPLLLLTGGSAMAIILQQTLINVGVMSK